MRTIICTVGTSVAAGANPLSQHRSSSDYSDAIRQHVTALRSELLDGNRFLAQLSAETNSLRAIKLERTDLVFLLHTETDDGAICARHVAEVLSSQLNEAPILVCIDGLQVDDAARFRRHGIQNLFKSLDQLREQAMSRGCDTVLNITGGYKSVVPYVTLYGLIHQLDTIYLFERSNALIHLPPAPLNFDYERLSRARVALQMIEDRVCVARDEFFAAIPDLEYHERDWFECLLESTPEEGPDQVTVSPLGLLFISDAAEQTAEVYLSPSAQQQLDQSAGDAREQFLFMLLRVEDPLWRKGKRHAFHGTDLAVFKPGNTGERMACLIRDRRVYVCELLLHDRQYEQVLASRRQKDYKLKQFTRWTPPADARAVESDEEILTRLQARNAESHERMELAEKRHRQLEQALASIVKPVQRAFGDIRQLICSEERRLEKQIVKLKKKKEKPKDSAEAESEEALVAELRSEINELRRKLDLAAIQKNQSRDVLLQARRALEDMRRVIDDQKEQFRKRLDQVTQPKL